MVDTRGVVRNTSASTAGEGQCSQLCHSAISDRVKASLAYNSLRLGFRMDLRSP